MKRFSLLLSLALSLSSLAVSDSLHIDLKNPSWKDSVFSTYEGGVVEGDSLRIQAETISLSKAQGPNEDSKIQASGSLMLELNGSIYVGKRLEYNLTKHTGLLIEGATSQDIWLYQAEKIRFFADGKVLLEQVKASTNHEKSPSWYLIASDVTILPTHQLQMRNLRFHLGPIPFLWLPYLSGAIDTFRNPPVTLSLRIGSKKDNRLGIRYRMYEGSEWTSYLRLAYHVSRGVGAGVDFSYNSLSGKSSLFSQNFYAKDSTISDPKKRARYQFTGNFKHLLRQGRSHVEVVYDKTSDSSIVEDFYTNDFTIRNVRNTYATLKNQTDRSIQHLRVKAQVNNFQTVKQEFPSLFATVKPLTLNRLGLVFQGQTRLEYLDLTYANGTPGVREFSAPRYHLSALCYRPFHLAAINISPFLGSSGAFYGNSPNDTSTRFAVVEYGLKSNLRLEKRYPSVQHTVIPYINFNGVSNPTRPLEDHYIFDYEDAYNRIQLISLGVRQQWSSTKSSQPFLVDWDLFLRYFAGKTNATHRLPRLYTQLSIQPTPSLSCYCKGSFYRPKHNVDLLRVGLAWTRNENFAFRIEGESRSRYGWLKANDQSFFLEATRPEEDLLASSLSRPQKTLHTHLSFRPLRSLLVTFETRNGWQRERLAPYNEWKTTFNTLVGAQWALELILEKTTVDKRVGLNLSLVGGKKRLHDQRTIW